MCVCKEARVCMGAKGGGCVGGLDEASSGICGDQAILPTPRSASFSLFFPRSRRPGSQNENMPNAAGPTEKNVFRIVL